MDFQLWLDRWADCILEDDFEAFLEMSLLPFTVTTPGASWTVADPQDYRLGFDVYRDKLRELGANIVARTLREIEHICEHHVFVTYDNHIMQGTRRVLAPTRARAELRQVKGQWKALNVTEIHTDETRACALPALNTEELHYARHRK